MSRFLLFVSLLFALRFLHFGPEIDAPHDWRQCDTAYYIRDFYQNGIDLLHPAVCWMGASDTLALEFPLPEAVAAATWQITGPSIPVARLIFLCFFAGAVFYFYQTVRLLFGLQTAQWSTLIYLALPLSIYYSRAIHIDFAAVCAAHAMLFYFLSGVEKKSRCHFAASGLAAALAFVIKAPYAFYFALPMLVFLAQQKAWKRMPGIVAWYLPALLLFIFWQQHVNSINGAAPDMGYILHYRKMTQSAAWYFGNLQQRLSLYPWRILLERGVLEVAGIGGIVFFMAGGRSLRRLPNRPVLLAWMLALAGYVLLFFNLNFVHNYYQIPLLAPVAILCAKGLEILAAAQPLRKAILFSFLLIINWLYCETAYYKIAGDHVEIGRLIQENTPDSALVIVTYSWLDCRNPKILYRARRRGWSVETAALKPEVIQRLRDEQGAAQWAYVGPDLPDVQLYGYPDTLTAPMVFDLTSISQKLYIFDLSKK